MLDTAMQGFCFGVFTGCAESDKQRHQVLFARVGPFAVGCFAPICDQGFPIAGFQVLPQPIFECQGPWSRRTVPTKACPNAKWWAGSERRTDSWTTGISASGYISFKGDQVP